MDERLNAVAARQHALLTTGQLLAHLTKGQLDHRVSARRLELVRRGVYRICGAPVTWEQAVLAAVLAAGPGAVASFRTAAVLHGLPGFDRDLLDVTVFDRRRFRLAGVTEHRSTVFGPAHTSVVRGISSASVARTLCDATAIVGPAAVEAALDDALRRRIVTLRRVLAVHRDLAGRGRRRCTVMAALLDTRLGGVEPGESRPERRIARWLVEAGLPRPRQQHRIHLGRRSVRVDVAYPDAGVLIEYDGWDAHRTRSAFDHDRARANELEVLGYTVLRFTSRTSRTECVELVRTALAAARTAGLEHGSPRRDEAG